MSDNESTLELLFDLVIKNHTLLSDIGNSTEIETYISKNHGYTLLGYSVVNNLPDLFKILLNRNKSNIYNVNIYGDSIFHISSKNKSTKFIDEYKDILDSFNFKSTNKSGCTVLHVASKYAEISDLFDIFLNHSRVTKEHLDIQDSFGKTCLFNLINCWHQTKSIRLLDQCIKKGANLFLKNRDNETIYDYAKKKMYRRLLNF